MTRQRRSQLQSRILLHLNESPINDISALASRLNCQRPSVSRSIHTLQAQGLVQHEDDGWRLTQTGRDQLLQAHVALQNTLEEPGNATRRASRVLADLGVLQTQMDGVRLAFTSLDTSKLLGLSRLAETFQSTLEGVMSQAIGMQRVSELAMIAVKPMLGSLDMKSLLPTISLGSAVSDSLAQVSPPGGFNALLGTTTALSEQYAEAIRPLLDAQGHSAALLKQLSSSLDFRAFAGVAQWNNRMLADALDNVLSVSRASASFLSIGQPGLDLSWLPGQIASVSAGYERLMRELAEHSRVPAASIDRLVDRVTLPTATITQYSWSARTLVLAEMDEDPAGLPEASSPEAGDTTLDALLAELDPALVSMRRGYWHASRTQGPDWFSQAACSQRELIVHVLEILAPTAQLPEDRRSGPQVKLRMKKVLCSESDGEYADALAQAVFRHYEQLNAYVHHNKWHAHSMQSILHVGEGLLEFILVNLRSQSSD